MRSEMIKNDVLREAYDGSFYTITGAGGEISDWVNGYDSLMAEAGIGKATKWVTFSGKDVDDEFGLTGTNRYPDDLTFLAFSLDGLDIGRLAIFKIRRGDRWFDDIVDNDLRREGVIE